MTTSLDWNDLMMHESDLALSTRKEPAALASVRLSPSELEHCIELEPPHMSPGMDSVELQRLLLYIGLRAARLKGKKTLLARLGSNSQELTFAPFQPLPKRPGSYGVDVAYGAIKVFEGMSEPARAWARAQLLPQELELTVRRRCQTIYGNRYFRSIFDGTMTRNQYIDSLANNHQFVRWTTRLLGRIIGVTADRTLRKSYIHHLEGEIDHELLLENDLRYLGADVDYVCNEMTPNVDIQQFMCIQESMSSFHRNPLLFLAVPFSIEGVTAFLGPEYLQALKKCIAGWGYDKPSHAVTFLASHIDFDGGDDGHWESSRAMFMHLLSTERELQGVLNVVHMVLDSFNRALESYVINADPMAPS